MSKKRTITTVKSPYRTSDGTVLQLGSVTEVEVDDAGKYIPGSATTTLKLFDTKGFFQIEGTPIATRSGNSAWTFLKDGNNNTIAGIDLQRTLANKNSLMNINLNNNISHTLGSPLQGVPAGQTNKNNDVDSRSALNLPPQEVAPDSTNQNQTSEEEQKQELTPEQINNSFTVSGKANVRKDYGDWSYPFDRGDQLHDFIKFSVIGYGKRKLSESGIDFEPERGWVKDIKGSVKLPIQSQITDNNSVKWNENPMNAAQLAASGIMIKGITSSPEAAFQSAFEAAQGAVSDSSTKAALQTIIASYFAEQGTGATNLQSRLYGAVLNPNLELLFEGPSLRPFNFNFKLTARDKNESNQIKGIIRFFKQAMAVQRSPKNLFLKTPNVFEIEYIWKNENLHPGLNKIKKCALQSFTVDYTPEGSYMSFDEDGTMVSYGLQMQFMELEPVYEDEYNSNNLTEIGY
jgi:hypothetical protein